MTTIAYAHVSNKGRSKLDDKSVKHVFIGYDASSKGYKLYNSSNGKIVVKNDEEVATPNEFSTPPPSPTHSIHEASSSKGGSSESPRKMRNLQDIYDEIKIINYLFYLFVEVSLNLRRSYRRQKKETRHGGKNQFHKEE
ncbi:Retrovirus-related Pol polyprotein from transposon TNT 1-94 [Glycine soja]